MMLRTMGRRAVRAWKARRFHAHQNQEAHAGYAAIVDQDPDRALSQAVSRQIDEYAGDVFKDRRYAPWLRLYAAYRGRFLEGWIPDSYYIGVVLPRLHGSQTGALRRKTLTSRVLGSGLFPDLAVHVRGCWLFPNGEPIPQADVPEILFAGRDAVFVKFDGRSKGRGVRRISRDQFDAAALAAEGDFVVQEPIEQAPFFAEMMPSNTATVRVLTTKSDGEPARGRGAFLRLGRRGEDYLHTAQQLSIPILDDRGTLGREAAMTDWTRTSEHPDTGGVFAGRAIPRFADMVRACEELHDRLPLFHIIGWDGVIDRQDRLRLMEWNGGFPGIKFLEAAVGPCFGDLRWERLARR
jgi:hypothetical protein